MSAESYEIGMVGLGVMGRNLVLNIADHGFSVAGYDKDFGKVKALQNEAEGRVILGTETLDEFLSSLRLPRAILLLVPAGAPVDAVIKSLSPHLKPGDVILDGGNSFFKDTDKRASALTKKGFPFLGVGISGGEQGARHGPSLMPGGPQEAYERVRPVFEAVAAKVNGEACVAYLGPGSVGHYVKMVHNGIEYALMELIAEAYDLMKRGLGLSCADLASVFVQWNQNELSSYLIEITAGIFRKADPRTGQPLVEQIQDVARQKGTGTWVAQEAMDLQVPVPSIDAAVSMRDLSGFKEERKAVSKLLARPPLQFSGDRKTFLGHLRSGLYAGMLLAYAQGMALLRAASQAHRYSLNLAEVARIWRGGCIIRAALLEKVLSAYRARPELPSLLTDPSLVSEVTARQESLRVVIRTAAELGIPAPGFMASLSYYDAFRSARLPANLIQAQRDWFGAHTYERVDLPGIFHTEWNKDLKE
jgi:6-phosphogluconate dehydrogenase